MDAARDSFQNWLDGFKKEVDTLVASTSPAGGPIADQAKRAFDNWWDANQDPLTAPAPDTRAERLETLAQDNSDLRVHLNELKAAAAAEREALTLQSAKLEAMVRSQNEREGQLVADKRFLEERTRAAENAKTSAEEELKLERERALLGIKELIDFKHQNAARVADIAKLREALASREGTLEELRRQASAYQNRLITAKELTDADVALLRQEIKMFVEEFRIIVNTIKRGETR